MAVSSWECLTTWFCFVAGPICFCYLRSYYLSLASLPPPRLEKLLLSHGTGFEDMSQQKAMVFPLMKLKGHHSRFGQAGSVAVSNPLQGQRSTGGGGGRGGEPASFLGGCTVTCTVTTSISTRARFFTNALVHFPFVNAAMLKRHCRYFLNLSCLWFKS